MGRTLWGAVTSAVTSGTVLTALVTAAAQRPNCDDVLVRARDLAGRLLTAQALGELDAQAPRGCDVRPAATYLRGLLAARAAATKGGDDESLAPVRVAAAVLEKEGQAGGPSEVASLVLRAAASAAQSEREEMAVFLAQALQLERALGARGASGAPVVSAHEMAGELWLQVHRYDEAGAAFLVARAYAGDSPRLALGLARTRVREKRVGEACDEYGRLVRQPPVVRNAMKVELDEAAQYLRQPACRSATGR